MGRIRYFKRTRRILKSWRKRLKRRTPLAILSVVLIGGIIIFAMTYSHMTINPLAYAPLLDTVAKVESKGNYNAYFGNAHNQEIQFTTMTLDEVLAWQADYIKKGSASSAVGRYQFLNTTLQSLQTELKLPGSTKFDPKTQDTLAIALMNRRGAVSFVENKVSSEDFAHNLSKEWASLPQTTGATPEKGYYDGDGLNQALVSPTEILNAISLFKSKAQSE